MHSLLIWLGYAHPQTVGAIQAKCSLYHAVSPAMDGFAGSVLGLSSFAVPIVIILLVAAIFMAMSRNLGILMKAIGVIIALGIAIVVAPAALGALNIGAC